MTNTKEQDYDLFLSYITKRELALSTMRSSKNQFVNKDRYRQVKNLNRKINKLKNKWHFKESYKYENYKEKQKMTKEEIVKILRKYEGEIVENTNENKLLFQGINTFEELTNVYDPVNHVYKLQPYNRCRLCTLEFDLDRNKFSANIQNCSGFNNYGSTEESIKNALKQYNFKEREMVQLNLFTDF